MAASKRAFNPTDSPVVIDDDGRSLGGGEWFDVDPSSDRVVTLVEQGRLLFPDDLTLDSEPIPAAPSAPTTTPQE